MIDVVRLIMSALPRTSLDIRLKQGLLAAMATTMPPPGGPEQVVDH